MGLNPSVLSRSERQDEFVKMLPEGSAKVIRRPKTNPDGSDIFTPSGFEFPSEACNRRKIEELFKAMRSGDQWMVKSLHESIKEFCGIEVNSEAIKKSSATPPNLVEPWTW